MVLWVKSSGHYAQGEEYVADGVYKEQIEAMVVNARAPAVSSEVGEWRPATVESVVQTASLLQAPLGTAPTTQMKHIAKEMLEAAQRDLVQEEVLRIIEPLLITCIYCA